MPTTMPRGRTAFCSRRMLMLEALCSFDRNNCHAPGNPPEKLQRESNRQPGTPIGRPPRQARFPNTSIRRAGHYSSVPVRE